MPDDYRDSVMEMLARNLTIDASIEIARAKTGEPGRDDDVEKIVYCVILASMEAFERQMAAPRIGGMTFEQAMDEVMEGKMVTRPGWGILRALFEWFADGLSDGYRYRGKAIADFELDNLEGGSSGSGSGHFSPTDDDLNATDWMIYQPPESFDAYLGE